MSHEKEAVQGSWRNIKRACVLRLGFSNMGRVERFIGRRK